MQNMATLFYIEKKYFVTKTQMLLKLYVNFIPYISAYDLSRGTTINTHHNKTRINLFLVNLLYLKRLTKICLLLMIVFPWVENS